jgi:FAD/FMN-containing dehydrogenase
MPAGAVRSRLGRTEPETMMTVIDSPLRAAIDDLRAVVRGPVLDPRNEGYEAARRVYNAVHDRRPGAIVQADSVADVLATVTTAHEHDLLLAIRGGAHSIAGFSTCDDGIVLDLGPMRGISVDREARTVRAGAGLTWAELNEATHAAGLAVTGGIVSTTGIAGLTLGGGLGHLARRCGLTCDNLVSAEVVTADGRLLTCSEDEHPDLFWALRGGGGNFGVVTAFEYRLHPVAEVLGGPTFYPLDGEIVAGYLDLLAEAPEELNVVLGLVLAPPAPFVAEAWHGRPVCALVTCWSGPSEEDAKVRDRLEQVGPVVGQFLDRLPYPAVNTLFDDLLPSGLRHYWKGCFNAGLSPAAIDAHVAFATRLPTPESATLVFPIDGACHRVAPEETAFSYRDADLAVGLGATWHDPADDADHIAWTRDYDAALRPTALAGGYVNFSSDDDATRVRANYLHNHARLVEVKRRYDPDNLFRLNQNIRPDIEDEPDGD